MWKCLRSQFAWRFSLIRLVMAVVFLGIFFGLNVCGPTAQIVSSRGRTVASHWGWPLPFSVSERDFDAASDVLEEPVTSQQFSQLRWLPWTHKTYRIVLLFPRGLFATGFAVCAIIDVLVGLVPLGLILFFHPRRRPPEPEPETAS
jgi:hypothetical protein